MEIKRYQEIMRESLNVKNDFLKEIDFEPMYEIIKKNHYKATEKVTELFNDIFEKSKTVEKLIDTLDIFETEDMTLILNTFSHFIMEKLQNFAKEKLELKNYDKKICPFCNNSLKYAIIDEHGKKFLVCSICNLKWNYPRIKCPFCENEDQKKLSYYQFEDEFEFVRVYKCEKCKRLHKVFLSEKMKKYSSFEEAHIGTAHIDLFIQEEENEEEKN